MGVNASKTIVPGYHPSPTVPMLRNTLRLMIVDVYIGTARISSALVHLFIYHVSLANGVT